MSLQQWATQCNERVRCRKRDKGKKQEWNWHICGWCPPSLRLITLFFVNLLSANRSHLRHRYYISEREPINCQWPLGRISTSANSYRFSQMVLGTWHNLPFRETQQVLKLIQKTTGYFWLQSPTRSFSLPLKISACAKEDIAWRDVRVIGKVQGKRLQ